MNIVILTEGGKDFGFGHVARCSSVYQAFLERDIVPNFIINGDESVSSILDNIEFNLCNWITDVSFLNSTDIVIIDSYIADVELYDEISKKVSLMVCFDDNNRLSYPSGIVINGLIGADCLNYSQDNIKYL